MSNLNISKLKSVKVFLRGDTVIKSYHVESCFNEMIEDISYLKFISTFSRINEYKKSKVKRKIR